MSEGRRRRDLEAAARAVFVEDFDGRVLPFDSRVAATYADLFAARGSPADRFATLDLMISSVARSHGAGVVTREDAQIRIKRGGDEAALTCNRRLDPRSAQRHRRSGLRLCGGTARAACSARVRHSRGELFATPQYQRRTRAADELIASSKPRMAAPLYCAGNARRDDIYRDARGRALTMRRPKSGARVSGHHNFSRSAPTIFLMMFTTSDLRGGAYGCEE